MTHGPQTPFSQTLHAQKYRGQGESFEEAMGRLARTLGDEPGFLECLLNMRFLPAGRIQSSVGTLKNVTAFNCYVSGTVEDSFVDGEGSIMDRAKEAATTMRMGGGIGYDFSVLRPRGADIKRLGSRSSGPVSFMEIFDAICRCVASSGHRRGAQMGVLRVDHPDIEEFVRAKHNTDRLTGFNVSVAITDEFMRAVEQDKPFFLHHGGQRYREVNARDLWGLIMQSTWDWAEPGVLFVDRVNSENNLHYCEKIAATNPCGEQPLPPYGACLLGSFNLVKYVRPEGRSLDLQLLVEDVHRAVRSMDRVIDVTNYPLQAQRWEALEKRRMGLGITGLANAVERVTGAEYGSAPFLELQDVIQRTIRDAAYLASVRLAEERGTFPALQRDLYLSSGFASRLPGPVRDAIAERGIRNSHLLSIAPAGTISLCADNVSSGIEPVFSERALRTVIGLDGPEEHEVLDYGTRHWQHRGKPASEVTVGEHLSVLALAQSHVDSAVSKTCNVPSSMEREEFSRVYEEAWRRGCKGITTFREGGKRGGILDRQDAACRVDPSTGRSECE